MIKTIGISREEMLDILWGSTDIILSDKVVDHARWSVVHTLIFKYDDKIYRTVYCVGATEYQEESPWECEGIVTCTEVEAVKETITVYQDVDA